MKHVQEDIRRQTVQCTLIRRNCIAVSTAGLHLYSLLSSVGVEAKNPTKKMSVDTPSYLLSFNEIN